MLQRNVLGSKENGWATGRLRPAHSNTFKINRERELGREKMEENME